MFSVIFHDHRPATIRSVPSRSSQNVLCVFFHDHRAATIRSSQNVLCVFFHDHRPATVRSVPSLTIDRRRSGRCHLRSMWSTHLFGSTHLLDKTWIPRANTDQSMPCRLRQSVVSDFFTLELSVLGVLLPSLFLHASRGTDRFAVVRGNKP